MKDRQCDGFHEFVNDAWVKCPRKATHYIQGRWFCDLHNPARIFDDEVKVMNHVPVIGEDWLD